MNKRTLRARSLLELQVKMLAQEVIEASIVRDEAPLELAQQVLRYLAVNSRKRTTRRVDTFR